MIYQYDQALQLPTVDLYDTLIMAMALNAAKDMYEKGEQLIKDFLKAYGDFLTPITADQNWYNQNVTGKVRDVINNIYARGGDPLRNAQDRAQISMLINTMPYGEMAKKKERAKNAEEYYKNMATLRMNDKYNEDFSKFLKEDPNQWADDFMGVTSPTAFKTLKDATNDWYNNRTPRDLTPDEIKKLGLDPRYNYTGYFDSDLLNVAKGQTPGWQGTPISAFYRDLAYKQLQAMGVDNPTKAQVEAMLQRNIANAQQEWLVGPKQGEVDRFKVLAAQNEYNKQNIILQDKLAGERAKEQHRYKMAEIAARYGAPGSGSRGNSKMADVFKYGEATQDAAIGRIVQSLLGNVDKIGANGLPELDKDGKRIPLSINDASMDDIRYAYSYKVLPAYMKFMKQLRSKYNNGNANADDNTATLGKNAFDEYLRKFGYMDSSTGFEASMQKKVNSDGKVVFAAPDINNVFTDAEVLAMAKGYAKMLTGYSHKEELARVFKNRKRDEGMSSDISKLYGNNANAIVEPMRSGIPGASPNKLPVILKDGTMIMLRAVNIKYGTNTLTYNTGRLWIPVGSPTLPETKTNGRTASLNPYTDVPQSMDQIEENARYLQATGSQKNQNVALSPEDIAIMNSDIANMDEEELATLMEQLGM